MPQVVVDNGPSKGLQVSISLDQQIVVGRDSKNSIPIKDPLISRRHFRIVHTKTATIVEDLKSVNGTFLNGSKLKKRSRISDGDRIQVGETILTYFEDQAGDPLIGKTISGFEVTERVGSGGMGNVYRARQISLDRFVALKVLSKDLAENRKFIELFHREARSAGQINHPSLVQVYDVDTVRLDNEDITFFAMEFMPGGSVEELLTEQGRIGLDQALRITLDTAKGLAFAEQRGLVHRDIKPGNLMFSETGTVKIGDLGIARRADAGSKVSQKDGISGSPHYIAPEQAMGKDIDTGADIYSLGVSLFHMLSGRPPFMGSSAKELVLKHVKEQAPDIKEFCPDLPKGAVDLLNRMMEKNRENRPKTAQVLVQEIEDLQDKIQSGWDDKAKAKQASNKKALKVASLLILIAILGSIGTITFFMVQNQLNKANTAFIEYRGKIQSGISKIEEKITAEAYEEAQTIYKHELQHLLDPTHERAEELESLFSKAKELEEEIKEFLALKEEEKKENEASAEWEKISEKLPKNLSNLKRLAAIRESIPVVEKFLEDNPERKAAKEAQEKLEALIEAEKVLSKRLRVATRDYNQVTIKVSTFLGANNYKDALIALREFHTEHPDTPEYKVAEERIASIQKSMMREVARRVEKVKNARSSSERVEALRELELLREGIEGDALSQLERNLESLRSNS